MSDMTREVMIRVIAPVFTGILLINTAIRLVDGHPWHLAIRAAVISAFAMTVCALIAGKLAERIMHWDQEIDRW